MIFKFFNFIIKTPIHPRQTQHHTATCLATQPYQSAVSADYKRYAYAVHQPKKRATANTHQRQDSCHTSTNEPNHENT